MPERPLIVLPSPAAATRSRLGARIGGPHLPGRARQGARLQPRLQVLQAYFDRRVVELRASAAGQNPEEVIVFETVGSVEEFLHAARRIRGFDFMAEWDIDKLAPDEDFFDEEDEEATLSGRLYLVMSNQEALRQLLRLWRRYQNNQGLPWGLGRFQALFEHLRDVRLWSVEDRLRETGVMEYWSHASESADETPVPFQIELWFRDSAGARLSATAHLRAVVTQLGGQLLEPFELPPIRYQAVTAILPASQIRQLHSGANVGLLGDNAVMFFRPSGQTVVPLPAEITLSEPSTPQSVDLPSGDPIIALFDGIPVENHARLAGRLQVDDPNGYAGLHPAMERQHGTTMASVIVHGDLSTRNTTLPHPLYVRPILRPDPQPWDRSRQERVPYTENELDLTHRAITRLFQGQGDTAGVAPTIRVVSFSIGDSLQQFHHVVSSWGRLLDWLALEFNVLFCVSVGNHSTPIELDVSQSVFAGLSSLEREAALLRALRRDIRLRRILAPSDSINALTVGAWHADGGGIAQAAYRFDPFESSPLPSPLNGLGYGFRNSIKPDVLFPGGRQFFQERLGNAQGNAILDLSHATVAPGILAAAPGTIGAQLDREKHSRGSSNAAALAARSAGFLNDQFINLRDEPGGDRLTDEFVPVLLKAAIVHRSSWRQATTPMEAPLRPADMREDSFKRLVSRFVGFGFVEPVEAIVSDDHRATMIGFGRLEDGRAHEYFIPLPQSLSGLRIWRRVIATLAWFSPVNARHRNYRQAAMWFDIERTKLAVDRHDADWRSARNGTVQHELFEGESAAAFSEEDSMLIRVNCRADAGELDVPVRYGLLITIEIAEGQAIPLYDEIAARIRPRVRVRQR